MDMRGLIHSRSAWYGKTGPVSYKVMRLISSLGGGTKIEGIRRGSETETSVGPLLSLLFRTRSSPVNIGSAGRDYAHQYHATIKHIGFESIVSGSGSVSIIYFYVLVLMFEYF